MNEFASTRSPPHRSTHQIATAGATAASAATRVVGVDVTRGLALLGMIAVHTLPGYDDSGAVSLSYRVAGGRSAATFAVLAGIGIAFMTRRRRVRWGEGGPIAAMLAVRAVAVAAIGLVLGYTDADTAGVILVFYGLLFAIAIPLVFLSTRALVTTALGVATCVPVLSHVLRPTLPEPVGENPSISWLLDDPGGLLAELLLTGLYPALPWTMYICVGLAIGRLDLSSAQVAARLMGVGAVIALAASLTSWVALGPLGGRRSLYAAARDAGMYRWEVTDTLSSGAYGTTPPWSWWWLATDAPHTSTPLDLLHTIGSAMFVLGAMLLVTRRSSVLRAFVKPLAAAGSMALTLYTAHIVFLDTPLTHFDATQSYMVQVVGALVFAVTWRHVFVRGPLEGLVNTVAQRSSGRFSDRGPRVGVGS